MSRVSLHVGWITPNSRMRCSSMAGNFSRGIATRHDAHGTITGVAVRKRLTALLLRAGRWREVHAVGMEASMKHHRRLPVRAPMHLRVALDLPAPSYAANWLGATEELAQRRRLRAMLMTLNPPRSLTPRRSRAVARWTPTELSSSLSAQVPPGRKSDWKRTHSRLCRSRVHQRFPRVTDVLEACRVLVADADEDVAAGLW